MNIGNPEVQRTIYWHNLIKPDCSDIFELSVNLMGSEMVELEQSNSLPNEVKEIADIIVTAIGCRVHLRNSASVWVYNAIINEASQRLFFIGVDWVKALHLVNQSNFSKLILAHEIEAASDYFAHAGIDVTIESLDDQYFGAYSSHDQTVNGNHYPAHKLLKSQNYAPIDESKEWW